ncbi:cobalamin biosynthesis protein CobD [Lutibacter sp. B2]|nr:cobalamin biosynthesis protein CobD [Lutibacter sp. B2]
MIEMICIGYIADLIFGDPYCLPHPIIFIGNLIRKCEKFLRKYCYDPIAEKKMGVVLTFFIVLITYTITLAILLLVGSINKYLYMIIHSFFIFQILATKSLGVETKKVFDPLINNNILEARKYLSYIVGRETKELNKDEITRACVETVAESTSDGIIAPLFYIVIGGAPLGMAYKAINTLDSMIGYKNDQYYYFGWAAAKLDDIVNYIPARITGICTFIAAFILRYDWKNSIRIFLRDRKNHKSPNSGHPESAFAGALRIQIGGTNTYFGKIVCKPTIGDKLKELESADIIKAIRLTYMTSFIGFVFGIIVRGGLL